MQKSDPLLARSSCERCGEYPQLILLSINIWGLCLCMDISDISDNVFKVLLWPVPLSCLRLHPTVFVMTRALAITTSILTILHLFYVSAQAPSCLPGFEWVRRQLASERKLFCFFFDLDTIVVQFFEPITMHYDSSSWGSLC